MTRLLFIVPEALFGLVQKAKFAPHTRGPWVSGVGGLLFVLFAAFAAPAYATDGSQIDWLQMGIQLFGGLAIFLFGMDLMANALKKVAGSRMKDILGRLTQSRIKGLFTGAFVTAIIQSSSVTTVILVGFVTTGLLSLSQAVGVILGANIGTTITAQIVAFKITKYALIFVSLGFGMNFFSKSKKVEYYGLLIMGLGLIFFGMGLMSAGMKPLRSFEPFIELMGSISNPLIGILVAAAFTGLVQSSSATLGVIIALSMQGLITLEAGIALALGANVGTCVTAGLAAIGKPREAVRVAVAHVLFNIIGVLLLVGFIGPFSELVRTISPEALSLVGADRLAAETPRQIANAHTIFNIAVALIFLPFLTPLARLCEKLVPDRPLVLKPELRPKFLDNTLLSTPSLALDRARLEVGRMGERVEEMLDLVGAAVLTGTVEELEAIAAMDSDVDTFHGHIIGYLREIGIRDLTHDQTEALIKLLSVTQQMEEIGDIIETSLVSIGLARISEDVTISPVTKAAIMDYHRRVAKAMQKTLRIVNEEDKKTFKRLQAMKPELARLADEIARHQMERLRSDDPNRTRTYTREVEVIDQYTNIYRLCRRIGKTVMDVRGLNGQAISD